MLASELDDDEAAVIPLASERQISGVPIDEKKARKVASLIYRLEVRGTAALLLDAKSRKLIPSVGDALNTMTEGG